ncbi:MAG: hypothetical protein DRH93_00650 [Deltaproteobacteria bacterium]|nr:MAG: hypothetical protein DRH93_00650 [Deltaproteobacteria bacterium]
MRKFIIIPTFVFLFLVTFLASAQQTTAEVGPESLRHCQDMAFSVEEDFVTHGPEPPDGNPVISDGDLLGSNCRVCARNADLLHTFFDVEQDLGLDAVHVINAIPEIYQVAFSTELSSPHAGQFTAGDLLITNVGIIPNVALLAAFNAVQGDLGLDAVQFVGDSVDINRFLAAAKTAGRQYWVDNPGLLAEMLTFYGIDILFSTEGTGPNPGSPLFLDGDFLSARFGVIVHSNGSLLPASVPAGIPARGVDFGLDAGNIVRDGEGLMSSFSTELLYQGDPNFTDGDVLTLGNGVVFANKDLINCFEPKADFLGLDAFFSTVGQGEMESIIAELKEMAKESVPDSERIDQSKKSLLLNPDSPKGPLLQLEACRTFAFSTEEDFLTRGPVPPDGNPIISDGDLLGRYCVICARNHELLSIFDVSADLGLDAVDVIGVETGLVVFSTELDSPNAGQFTAGDLLATNGTIIPNTALLKMFNINYDIGLDALFFVGELERIAGFLNEAREFSRDFWLRNPDVLVDMLRQWQVDIWFSTEGTSLMLTVPSFLDGDLLSVASGVIATPNSILLPNSVPAGIPHRGVDFGLDAVAGHRDGLEGLINFSTELLFNGEPGFSDGDVLKQGNGVVGVNKDLILCFEPAANFLGLDALSGGWIPPCDGDFNHDGDVDGSDLAVFKDDFGRTDCGVPTTCPGDFDDDGDVAESELVRFAANFGRTDCT